ncbi:MAG: glucose-6-phosphate dehydrogenase [Bacteroidaceae bacterium]|nr:glucose-6-phosphate dehydrogenase [Bacteroidaceae bacterium]
MEKVKNIIIVIFGASGDLAKRKLMPAIYMLYKEKRLPLSFAIVGVSRTPYSDKEYRNYMKKNFTSYLDPEEIGDNVEVDKFIDHLYYHAMDPAESNGYKGLNSYLRELDETVACNGNYLYYLATPPSLYGVIPQHLKLVHLNENEGTIGKKRIIVEKPFGFDLQSAYELNKIYRSVFNEEQIFRIDHFLGKETVQSILAFRFANSIFEPLWNRNYVDYVEVTAVENMGIENRGGFFDQTGTLRDMVQNHLLQLLALMAMEPPVAFDAKSFRDEVLKVYNSLIPLKDTDLREHIVRGQYMTSERGLGYREEKNVDSQSRTETYIAMRLELNSWRWKDVPFYIRTGKQMPTKVSEIVIHFKSTPQQLFGYEQGQSPKANKLVLRIQPNEGVLLRFGTKVPGAGFDIHEVEMDFNYKDFNNIPTEDAYSRLIEDCMLGDPTLFTRSDAVEASWKFFSPVIDYWKKHPEAPLYGYPAGSWGPQESEAMMTEHHAEWTNPCKNLTKTDLYCEL